MGMSLSRLDNGERGGRTFVRPAGVVCLALAALFALNVGAWAAQSSPPTPAASPTASAPAQGQAAHNPDKLYVDADEIAYDKDKEVVTANGNVALYYKGRILQADRVVYDRKNKRMRAEGRSKFTDEHGNVTYAPYFDLTDDFASGFANGVRRTRNGQRNGRSAPAR